MTSICCFLWPPRGQRIRTASSARAAAQHTRRALRGQWPESKYADGCADIWRACAAALPGMVLPAWGVAAGPRPLPIAPPPPAAASPPHSVLAAVPAAAPAAQPRTLPRQRPPADAGRLEQGVAPRAEPSWAASSPLESGHGVAALSPEPQSARLLPVAQPGGAGSSSSPDVDSTPPAGRPHYNQTADSAVSQCGPQCGVTDCYGGFLLWATESKPRGGQPSHTVRHTAGLALPAAISSRGGLAHDLRRIRCPAQARPRPRHPALAWPSASATSRCSCAAPRWRTGCRRRPVLLLFVYQDDHMLS